MNNIHKKSKDSLWHYNLYLEYFKKKISNIVIIFIPYGWHILFFLIPFLLIFKLSFAESIIGSPPYKQIISFIDGTIINIKLNLDNYFWIFEEDLYIRSYLESLKMASIATLCCIIIGYPMAYGITRVKRTYRIVLLMMVMLPFWTSFLIRVYAWIGILSDNGILNRILLSLGIIKTPIALMDNELGTMIGLVYSYIPFMILPLYSSLEKISNVYIEAAYDLGCRPIKAFFHVIIPLSYRGVIGGSMLVFIPSVGEFVIPALLGGANSIMIGKVLWNEFFINHDWPLASSLVVAMFFVLFLPILLFQNLLSPSIKHKENKD